MDVRERKTRNKIVFLLSANKAAVDEALDHAGAQALLLALDGPVAAPSANVSGKVSATTAEHVLDGLDGRIDAVIDMGPCEVGLEIGS